MKYLALITTEIEIETVNVCQALKVADKFRLIGPLAGSIKVGKHDRVRFSAEKGGSRIVLKRVKP